MLSALPAFFIPALTFYGFYLGGLWSFLGLAYVFGLHPVLDQIIGDRVLQRTSHARAELLLNLTLPTMFLLWAYCLSQLPRFDGLSLVGAILSLGAAGGAFGITASHELIHRTHRLQQYQGVGLLALVNYSHFSIEHVYGHHKWVATPHDPATSRLGESVYKFWIRSIWGGFDSAIRISKQFKQQSKLQAGLFIQGLLLPLAFAIGGSQALLAHLASSLVAILLLETINFIEHYGLVRQQIGNKQFEPVKPNHSWDSHRYLTNSSLFNLGLHSHHHYKASVPYEQLRATSEAPVLPFGYSVMFLIALAPPLWRRVMDPRVKALSSEPSQTDVTHQPA